jgi:hypothetical protein
MTADHLAGVLLHDIPAALHAVHHMVSYTFDHFHTFIDSGRHCRCGRRPSIPGRDGLRRTLWAATFRGASIVPPFGPASTGFWEGRPVVSVQIFGHGAGGSGQRSACRGRWPVASGENHRQAPKRVRVPTGSLSPVGALPHRDRSRLGAQTPLAAATRPPEYFHTHGRSAPVPTDARADVRLFFLAASPVVA